MNHGGTVTQRITELLCVTPSFRASVVQGINKIFPKLSRMQRFTILNCQVSSTWIKTSW
jgi:hypothetical protein